MAIKTHNSRRLVVLVVIALIALILLSLFTLMDFGSTQLRVEWEIWTIATAVGTVGATAFSVFIAWRGNREERDAVARLVSAWITEEYVHNQNADGYRRLATLHIANESNEPVYEGHVSIHIHDGKVVLGSLNVPNRIVTIPPRRHLEFDISAPLLAHKNSEAPQVEISFRDANKRRWSRGIDGVLSETTKEDSMWVNHEGVDIKALGDEGPPWNPMAVALEFLASLRDPENGPVVPEILLGNQSGTWTNMDWSGLNQELSRFQPTTHVSYPAPRIAFIKLLSAQALEDQTEAGSSKPQYDYLILTLTLDLVHGWKVYSVGHHIPVEQVSLPNAESGQ